MDTMSESESVAILRLKQRRRRNIRGTLREARLVVPVMLSLLLYASSFYSYLLFHTLAEFFAIGVAMLLFAVAWNTYKHSQNHFLMFLACGYFWIACLNIVHALSYQGMNIIEHGGANISTQFWIVPRYLEAFMLLAAPLFIRHTFRHKLLFPALGVAAVGVSLLILSGRFPDGYVEGQGLTRFKVVSEYIIILLMGVALLHLGMRRRALSALVYYLVSASIILTMCAELSFTLYNSVFDLANLAGHLFKLFSYWLLFVVVVETTLVSPYESLKTESDYRITAQQALRGANRALRTISLCNEIMVHAEDESRLLQQVCDVIVDTGGYRLAWAGYREEDETMRIRVVARAGVEAEFLDNPELSWKALERRGFPPGRAIREAEGIVVQDIFSDPSCEYCREDAERYGFSSLIALPLLKDAQAFGVLTIYAADTHTFSVEEVDLLSELADDLAYGIATLRERRENERLTLAILETEERFRNLSEQSLVGVYLIQDKQFKYVNPRFAEIAGYAVEEIIGRLGPRDLVTERDWPTVRENLRRRFAGEVATMNYEFQLLRKDGQAVDVEVYGSSTLLQGKPAIIGSLLDISARKRGERELRASENRLRTIIEAEPECVKLVDPEGRFQEVNPAGLAMLEAGSDGQVLGRRVIDFVVEQDRQSFLKSAEQVFQGDTARFQCRIQGLKGTRRYVETHAVPLREDGRVVAMLAVTRDITRQKHAERMMQESTHEMEHFLTQTIEAVAMTAEKRDPYTAGHQRRVAELAMAIATAMGLDDYRIKGIRLGGVIHDIGKIYIPAEILNRPGRLNKGEFEIIKTHPEVGYEILKDVHFPWPVHEMILQHHERIDGSGYPRGLKGDEITLEARILAVADVVEAVTSHRPYRPAHGLDKALQIIEEGAGTLFDPEIVVVCRRLFDQQAFRFAAA